MNQDLKRAKARLARQINKRFVGIREDELDKAISILNAADHRITVIKVPLHIVRKNLLASAAALLIVGFMLGMVTELILFSKVFG